MKKIFLLVLLAYSNIKAQSFTAETGDLFLGDEKGVYFGVIKVLTGTLKKTDVLEVYAETGRKFTLTITKLKVNDKDAAIAKPRDYVFADFFTKDNADGGNDYLRKGYKVYPKGFNAANASTTNTTTKKKTDFTATLDGKIFNSTVTYKGASYWRKGVKKYIEKPYLQLQFGCIDNPDDRLLTIQIFNPKESPAVYKVANMEVNFSGSIDGKKENTTIFGFVNGNGNTDFTVEITEWQIKENNKAIISGKVYGKLKQVLILGKNPKINSFENGVFEKIEVEIFNDLAVFTK